jgi:hypothetical protein
MTRSSAESASWGSGVDRALFVATVTLYATTVACWFALLLRPGNATADERRGLLVCAALFAVIWIGRTWESVAVVFVPCVVLQLVLTPLLIWYLAKAAGEETQRDINAKLRPGVSAPSKSLAQKV